MTRRELVLLWLILLAGTGLRLAALSRSAVEHFDEGVYASNLWFGPPDYAYPQRQFYAPPLLPALIEAGMIVGLPPNLAALLPGVLAGSATITALWWFGRTWFSPSVGLAAATLCAFSDLHITLSATALTDAVLGLWIVLAVQSIGLSLARGDLRWAVAAGIFTGLAWWTKYNGWLPLAIEAAGLAQWFVLRWRARQLDKSYQALPPASAILQFSVTALIAALVWLPYLVSLQSAGGYAPIAANHARYVVGLTGWPDSLCRHTAGQQGIEGPLSWIGVALAAAFPWIAAQRARYSMRTWCLGIAWCGGALLLSILGSTFVLVVVAAPLGLLGAFLALRNDEQGEASHDRRLLGLALVAAWYLGLALATPCYFPYPRLLLPWLLAAWLGTATLFDELTRVWQSDVVARQGSWRLPVTALTILLTAALVAHYHHPRFVHEARPTGDRRGVLSASRAILEKLGASREPRIVYVYGEPAMLFQLRAAGEPLVVPVQSIPSEPARDGGRPIETLLIVGPHSLGTAEFPSLASLQSQHWELIDAVEYAPSPIVYLDLYDPRLSTLSELTERNQFQVFRLQATP